MLVKRIVGGLYMIPVGPVNVYFFDSPDGCTLIDTGFPGDGPRILRAIQELGKQPTDVRSIILTHAHPDHIGSAAALKRATGADVYVHPIDKAIVVAGTGFRPIRATAGLVNKLLVRFVFGRIKQVEPTAVDHDLSDQQELMIAGGLKVILTPGHCAGQVALLWGEHGGVLIAADACSNRGKLKLSPAYENLNEGEQSLKKLAALNFKVACFGHGNPITENADVAFRRVWPDS